MLGEIIIGLIILSLIVFYFLARDNAMENETPGCVVEVGNEKNFDKMKISKTLKASMSYAMFVFPLLNLLMMNSGPDTCVSRDIKVRSFGTDEIIISNEEVRIS